jgi:hypothetical protein
MLEHEIKTLFGGWGRLGEEVGERTKRAAHFL